MTPVSSRRKCCDGYTYKCDECRQKFCLDCQRSQDYKGKELSMQTREDQRERLRVLEEEIDEARRSLDRRHYEAKESAFREMKEYIEFLEEPLDKAALLRELNDKINEAKENTCTVQ